MAYVYDVKDGTRFMLSIAEAEAFVKDNEGYVMVPVF